MVVETIPQFQVSEMTVLQLLVSLGERCPRRLIPLCLTDSWSLQSFAWRRFGGRLRLALTRKTAQMAIGRTPPS
jgi:hypothetical protein